MAGHVALQGRCTTTLTLYPAVCFFHPRGHVKIGSYCLPEGRCILDLERDDRVWRVQQWEADTAIPDQTSALRGEKGMI